MPLSEQEQRLLDEMERHLMRNDADVVSAPTDGRTLSYRNIVYGTILVLVGLGGLIFGVSTTFVVVGVTARITPPSMTTKPITPTKGLGPMPVETEPQAKPHRSTSFMDRMNDRWDRRQEDR